MLLKNIFSSFSGSALLGRCDELTKIKKICEQSNVWLHVIGDLLGSLALLSSIKDNVNISCDSLTMDIMKLFGIQNLPYLTFYLRSTTEIKQPTDDKTSLITSHPLYEYILHSPSISFLSVWSISQRCSNENILHHMKQSFHLTNLLIKRLKDIKTLRILNDVDQQENNTFQRLCSGDAPNDVLPKPVVIFRFESNDLPEVSVAIAKN
jgi:glutamate/tyrosine decarboxylase-like PLP-dependent enzyme